MAKSKPMIGVSSITQKGVEYWYAQIAAKKEKKAKIKLPRRAAHWSENSPLKQDSLLPL